MTGKIDLLYAKVREINQGSSRKIAKIDPVENINGVLLNDPKEIMCR